jgi:hypothetical protein
MMCQKYENDLAQSLVCFVALFRFEGLVDHIRRCFEFECHFCALPDVKVSCEWYFNLWVS